MPEKQTLTQTGPAQQQVAVQHAHARQQAGTTVAAQGHTDQRPAFAAQQQMIQMMQQSPYAQQQAAQQRALFAAPPPIQRMPQPTSQVQVKVNAQAVTAGVNSSQVVQREAITQIILRSEHQADMPVIQHIVFYGRSPKPVSFGSTMGGHSTAWVALTDSFNRILSGQSFFEARGSLLSLATDALESPFLADPFRRYMVDGHAEQLQEAQFRLREICHQLTSRERIDEADELLLLQNAISSILDVVNLNPFSTVLGASTHGQGEPQARGNLLDVENSLSVLDETALVDIPASTGDGDTGMTESRQSIDNIIKGGAQQLLSKEDKDLIEEDDTQVTETIKRALRQQFWTLFAEDTINVFSRDLDFATGSTDYRNLIILGLSHFLQVVHRAYPRAFIRSDIYLGPNILDFLLNTVGVNAADATFAATAIGNKYTGLNKRVGSKKHESRRGNYRQNQSIQVNVAGGQIVSIDFEARTKSPYAGMGAHVTAWIAHQDMVRQVLQGNSLPDAIALMRELIAQAERSPAIGLAKHITNRQKQMIIHGHRRVIGTMRRAVQARTDVMRLMYLQMLINDYLEYVNFLPLTTVNIDGYGGREQQGRPRLWREQQSHDEPHYGHRSRTKNSNNVKEDLFVLFDRKTIDAFAHENMATTATTPTAPSINYSSHYGSGRPKRQSQFLKELRDQEMTEFKQAQQVSKLTKDTDITLSDDEEMYFEKLSNRASPITIYDADEEPSDYQELWIVALETYWHVLSHAYPAPINLLKYSTEDLFRSLMEREGVYMDIIGETLSFIERMDGSTFNLPEGFLEDQFQFGDEFGDSSEMDLKFDIGVLWDESSIDSYEAALKDSERTAANRDGITLANGWILGHATGDRNACLIASLLNHANVINWDHVVLDNTDEVLEVQDEAIRNGIIRDHEPIDIFSAEGRALIEFINEREQVEMEVSIVYQNGIAPVRVNTVTTPNPDPVTIYLAPGHYVPVWRSGDEVIPQNWQEI